MSTPDEFISKLIDMYRERPYLWKVQSKEYRDIKLKTKAYEELAALAKPYFPRQNCNINFIKMKIKSIRTVFKKEWQKVRNATRSGASAEDVYKPKLWYYDLLTFTVDENELRPMLAPAAEEAASVSDTPGTSHALEATPEDDEPVAGTSQSRVAMEPETSQGECTDRDLPSRQSVRRPAKKATKQKHTSDELLDVATSFLAQRMEPCPSICVLLQERKHNLSDTQRRHINRLVGQIIEAGERDELTEASNWPLTPSPTIPTRRRSGSIRARRRGAPPRVRRSRT